MELLELYLTIGAGVYFARVCRTAGPGSARLIAAIVSLVVLVVWPLTLVMTFGEKLRSDRAYSEHLVKTAMHFKYMDK